MGISEELIPFLFLFRFVKSELEACDEIVHTSFCPPPLCSFGQISKTMNKNQERGREAVALSETSAKIPARNRGYAAAAIIAALSVESARLGKKV